MFWRRKGPEPEPEPQPAELGSRDELQPVRIYTSDATIDGWIDLQDRRLSDVLNVEERLTWSRVASAPADGDWSAMDRGLILLVVPPPHLSDREMRIHRVKRRLLVHSGNYIVRGIVHMIAGIDLDPFLARSGQHFLAVTDASVTNADRPELEDRHPALLINVRSTGQRLRLEVLT